MAAPTYVGTASTIAHTTADKNVSRTPGAVGNKLIFIEGAGDNNNRPVAPTATGYTSGNAIGDLVGKNAVTAKVNTGTVAQASVNAFQALNGALATSSTTFACTNSSTGEFGGLLLEYGATDEIENAATYNSGTSLATPNNLSFTTLVQDEEIILAIYDWNNGPVTTPGIVTPAGATGTMLASAQIGSAYAYYIVRYTNTGAPGVKTIGIAKSVRHASIAFGVGAGGPTPITGSDTVTVTEGTAQYIPFLDRTESVTFTEASSQADTLTGTDSAALSESSAVQRGLAGTDTATLSDSSATVQSDSRSGTESGTLSDSSSTVQSDARSGTDTGTLSDSSAVQRGLAGTDSAALSDSSSLSTSDAKSGTESATFTDASALAQSDTRSGTDSGTLSEASAASVVISGGSDSISFSEASDLDTGGGGGTPYSGFGAADPGVTFGGDGNNTYVATAFRTSLPGQFVTKARYFLPSDSTGTLTGAVGFLFDRAPSGDPRFAGTVPIDSIAFGTLVRGDWNEATFTTPIPINADEVYWIAVWLPGNNYGFIGGFFTGDVSPVPSGALGMEFEGDNIVNDHTVFNGTFSYSATSATTPSWSHFSAAWYGSDVELTGAGGPSTEEIDTSDSATLTESSAIERATSTSDTGTVTDVTTAVVVVLSGSEVVSFGESSSLGNDVSKAGTESAALSEAKSLANTVAGTEAGTLTDSSALVKNETKSGTESITFDETLTDVTLIDLTPDGVLSEGSQIASTLSRTDSVTFSDSSSVNTGTNVTASDTFTVTEGRAGVDTLSASDSASLSESGVVGNSTSKAGTDLFTLTESTSRSVTLNGQDAFGLLESIAVAVAILGSDVFTVLDHGAITGGVPSTDSYLFMLEAIGFEFHTEGHGFRFEPEKIGDDS